MLYGYWSIREFFFGKYSVLRKTFLKFEMQKKHISIEMNVVHLTIFWWKRRFLHEFQGFKLSKNEKKNRIFENWKVGCLLKQICDIVQDSPRTGLGILVKTKKTPLSKQYTTRGTAFRL